MFLASGTRARRGSSSVRIVVAAALLLWGASSPANADDGNGHERRQNPAILTEISKNPDLANDFLRFNFVPASVQVTNLAGPAALRTFMTFTAFFEPPLPLAKAVRLVGLEPVEDQRFLAIRCKEPDLSLLQPVLAKWPEVFGAILLDFGTQFTCPPMTSSPENEILCIVESFSDTPPTTASEALRNVYETAAMLTSDPVLQATLRRLYGIDVGFSGLGLGVNGSGSSSFVMSAENILDNAIVPEYLVENASIAEAGCRCLLVEPYPGRDQDVVDPDFIWRQGRPECRVVSKLRPASGNAGR